MLILGQGAGVITADHGGREIGSFLACDRPVDPPRCTSVGDDRLHLVAFDGSLSDDLAAALRASMAEDYDAPTRLVLKEQARITRLTDVIAFSGDYGDNGAAGWVYCPADAPQGTNGVGDRWCRHQELHLNVNARFGLFFDDEASRGHVACHELGHTLGLLHWGNPPQTDGPVGETCMNANTPNGPTSLHETDVDHLNAYRFPVIPRPAGVRIVRAPREQPIAFAGEPAGRLDALETGVATTLEELIGDSDAVVHGRIVSVAPGRTFGPANRPLHYAAATVEVLEQLDGVLPKEHAKTLTLELPLFEGLTSIDGLAGTLVGSDRILFLRNKGASAADAGLSDAEQLADADYYRLVSFASEVVKVGGSAVAPESEHAFLDSLSGRSFNEALEIVRLSAGR